MPKLLVSTRDYLERKLLDDAFQPLQGKLKKRERALATKVILTRYGKDAFAKFAAVPVGWLPTGKTFYVRYDGVSRGLTLDEARALPAELTHGVHELSDALGRELTAIVAEGRRLDMEREKLRCEVRAALAGFATVAQLRDGWPEAHRLLAVPEAPAYPVPAVRVEAVNERIAALKEAA